ncbi:MAG TPA: HD domain-containing phosphohydrolase [Gemmataceae bacterium]|nr:HD domain-containing phosphohydrolase [Gemmataceae bacterium]
MTDTRALLNRIAEFRKRLDAMPRLNPAALQTPPVPPASTPETALEQQVRAGSRTQALIGQSLRELAGTDEKPTPALTNRARRLLTEAQGLVNRLKAVADDPLLSGPPPDTDGTAAAADPLAVHYQETAALTEAAVRYALTFPDSAAEQIRLCEGLEALIDAARHRFALLAGAVEQRRADATWVDVLARFLTALGHGDGPVDPTPVVELAHGLLAEEAGRPLRFLSAAPTATQAYLGGPEFDAPARFVAAHSLNCAKIVVRLVRNDAEWRGREADAVLAALLHDVGMLGVDPAVLAQTGPLVRVQRRAVEMHARVGAEIITLRLPTLAAVAEVASGHHERPDGTGYPLGLKGDQVSPLARLIAAADVYAAMCSARPHRPPLDPRTALADTMLAADRGHLDREAADNLLALGFYPAGTVVELADGTTGLVLNARDPRLDPVLAARPYVALLADAEGRALPNPKYVDVAETTGSVVRSLGSMERWQRLGRAYPEVV